LYQQFAYHKLQNYDVTVDSKHDIIVEIGSERGHGSTLWLGNLAQQLSIPFYSVDVVPQLSAIPGVNFCTDISGSAWCQHKLPALHKQIKILYLDNFDWNYDLPCKFPAEDFANIAGPGWPRVVTWNEFYQLPDAIQKECVEQHEFDLSRSRSCFQHQIEQYAQRGIDMNNRNCVQEHLDQIMYALPYMSAQCAVVCDDTFICDEYDVWTGKCAAVIPFLQHHGFEIVDRDNNSVMLVRH
jgi:hypothetical protein